jgi:hypothetical protein
MALWKRKISLMAGVAGGALTLALIGDAVGLGQAVTVAIAGIALALVIVIGGPWAFGDGRFATQHWDAMHAHEAAVVARKQEGREGLTRSHLVYFETMEDYLLVEGGPTVLSTGPAGASGPFIEGEAEFVEIGNGVGHDD